MARQRPVRDDWILPTLESLLGREVMSRLEDVGESGYWGTAVRLGLVTDAQVVEGLAARYHMKVADLVHVSPQARDLVPEALARRYRILPLAATDSSLEIATADPNDYDCERTLAFATGRNVRMAIASPTRIMERIDDVYRPENAVAKILEGVSERYDVESITESIQDDTEMDIAGDGASKRPVIRLVDHIVAEAISSRASDIHVEPEEGGVRLQYRIDGVLREVMTLPRAAGLPLVSRIKIMAQMDIADRLRPQDGRARVSVNGNRVDLRVSTLPAAHGEKVVIRILDSRTTVLSVDKLGLAADQSDRIQRLLELREGIVLVTGPTGSGKTTTLYSALRAIQARNVNIVTVEDPVEYKLQGVVQVQVNEKAGLTFSSALRSILRQDPDVILVGEVRDRETAAIAVQASLTGHLVLSTLHTIDAVSSVARLLDIGVESYKIAAALKGVIAQRLLRRLCPVCRAPLAEAVPARYRRWLGEATTYGAVGCPACAQTGYHGRLAIMEVMHTTPEIEQAIAAADQGDRIATAARAGGMRSLWEVGLDHVRDGTTSLDELLRVVEPPLDTPVPRTEAPMPERSVEPARDARAPTPAVAPRRATPSSIALFSPSLAPTLQGEAFELLDGAGPSSDEAEAASTVLIVDDEPSFRAVVRDLVERDGHSVAEAVDGISALEAVDRWAPELIVLDIDMPGIDGFEVLSRLRGRPLTANVPILVLSARSGEADEVRAFDSGATDFVTKPFRPKALAARLRSLMRR